MNTDLKPGSSFEIFKAFICTSADGAPLPFDWLWLPIILPNRCVPE